MSRWTWGYRKHVALDFESSSSALQEGTKFLGAGGGGRRKGWGDAVYMRRVAFPLGTMVMVLYMQRVVAFHLTLFSLAPVRFFIFSRTRRSSGRSGPPAPAIAATPNQHPSVARSSSVANTPVGKEDWEGPAVIGAAAHRIDTGDRRGPGGGGRRTNSCLRRNNTPAVEGRGRKGISTSSTHAEGRGRKASL